MISEAKSGEHAACNGQRTTCKVGIACDCHIQRRSIHRQHRLRSSPEGVWRAPLRWLRTLGAHTAGGRTMREVARSGGCERAAG